MSKKKSDKPSKLLNNKNNNNTIEEVIEQQDQETFIDENGNLSTRIKKIEINYKTENQEKFANLIDNKDIILCKGGAGCGKTHISIAKALDLMNKFPKKYKKIIITTPTQEADNEKIGFLPGSVEEKLAPYTYSIIYLFNKILGNVKTERLLKQKRIEILALSFLRGLNLENCILICDETQNISARQMKTLLTRIGTDCKMILSGDIQQVDKKFDKSEINGLEFAIRKLNDVPQIGIMEFLDSDIVRHPLISVILKKFNGDV